MTSELRQLRRVRWGVRLTLALGISASLAANVLHARHLLIDQIISGWPPVAVFATIEAIARVPIRRRWLAIVRMTGLGFVAGIAFWVSYWHMASVAAAHGENGSKYLLPLSVDGLVVVASISLVELTGQISAAEATARAAAAAVTATRPPPPDSRVAEPPPAAQQPTPAVPAPPTLVPELSAAQPDRHRPAGSVLTPPAVPPLMPAVISRGAANGGRPGDAPADLVAADAGGLGDGRALPAAARPRIDAPAPGTASTVEPVVEPIAEPVPGPVVAPVAEVVAEPVVVPAVRPDNAVDRAGDRAGDEGEGRAEEVPPANPSEAIVWWRAKDPTLTLSQIAAKVGRSERTVRRILDAAPVSAAPAEPSQPAGPDGGSKQPTNGAAVDGLASSVVSSA